MSKGYCAAGCGTVMEDFGYTEVRGYGFVCSEGCEESVMDEMDS